MLKKVIKILTDSTYRDAVINVRTGYRKNLSDDKYLKKWYKMRTGKELNLDNPTTFSEKLQWLKLNDRKPEYTILSDKYKAKEYIATKIGKEHIIPLLGVWEKVDDIDFDSLPNQFVLKCNHNSGGLCICKDKSKINIEEVKESLNKALKQNYFYAGREWVYKDIPPRIIAEKYMTDESGTELKDYKIFNFNGEPKFIEVDFDRFVEHKRNFYTTDWEFIDCRMIYKNDPNFKVAKPSQLEEMLSYAKILSKDIPFLRTDFYVIGDKIYFGECTFYPEAGIVNFTPEEFNNEVDKMLTIKNL